MAPAIDDTDDIVRLQPHRDTEAILGAFTLGQVFEIGGIDFALVHLGDRAMVLAPMEPVEEPCGLVVASTTN